MTAPEPTNESTVDTNILITGKHNYPDIDKDLTFEKLIDKL